MNDKNNNECFLCSKESNIIISVYDDDFFINKLKNNYSCHELCKFDLKELNDTNIESNTDIFIINLKDKNEDEFKNIIETDISNFINYLKSIDVFVPILFICKGIQIKKIYELLKTDYIYEIINSEYSNIELKNKLDTLLKITRYQKNLKNKALKLEHSLWDLLNYSNLYILILDKNFDIIMCSDHLSKTLGYKDVKKIIGKNWLDFIPEYLKDTIYKMKNKVFDEKKHVKEYTNEIINGKGKEITVKWFNSYINHDINWTFSIGIPFQIYEYNSFEKVDNDNDINNIRSYFNDILNRDKIVINTINDQYKNKENNIDVFTDWSKRRNITYCEEL